MNNKTAEAETPSSISIILQMIRKPSSVIITETIHTVLKFGPDAGLFLLNPCCV